jgi:hypothetical protein
MSVQAPLAHFFLRLRVTTPTWMLRQLRFMHLGLMFYAIGRYFEKEFMSLHPASIITILSTLRILSETEEPNNQRNNIIKPAKLSGHAAMYPPRLLAELYRCIWYLG